MTDLGEFGEKGKREGAHLKNRECFFRQTIESETGCNGRNSCKSQTTLCSLLGSSNRRRVGDNEESDYGVLDGKKEVLAIS